MKYLNTIKWRDTDYFAPKGYYFLNVGDAIIQGDGYFNGNKVDFYPTPNNQIVRSYFTYPTVRPIPVEKAPAPAKLEYKEITNIEPGDIFLDKVKKTGCLIIQSVWNKDAYSLSGFKGLYNYSNCQSVTKEEMINYLNKYQRIFITNINDKIDKTIQAASKMM